MLRAAFFGEHAMRASTECVLGSLPTSPPLLPTSVTKPARAGTKRSPGAASNAQSGQPVRTKLNVPLLHTSISVWLEFLYTLIVPVKVPRTLVVLNDPWEVVTKRPL